MAIARFSKVQQGTEQPTRHEVFQGDARELSFIATESVHFVCTSPPYGSLKEYPDHPNQLGNIGSYEKFLDEMDTVWAECLRILVPGGRKLEAMLAPMFPIKTMGIGVAPSQPKLPLDLPLFGLVGERHNLLIIDDPNENDQRFRRLLVLFTSADRAMRFLEPFIQHGLIEPQQIVEFGPSALEQLLELLREAAHHTAAMTINPGEPRDTPQPCLRVSEVIDKLEMILERTHRMFRSGLNNVLLEKHTVGSKEILTMQISDGRYAALESPESPIFFGTTREEALTNLCQANGMLPDSI